MPKKTHTFWRFLISKVFFKNLLIALAITLILIIGVNLWLRIFTDHGDEITVPNFTFMSLQEVDQLCYQKNLQWLSHDSTYVRDQPGGIVLEQYPIAGSKVKKNRKVFLTTNSWYPELIPMPLAYDMSYRNAKRILEGAGLFIDSLEYEPYFARTYVRKQKYMGQEILEGTPIEKGSGVTLVLGQGLSNEKGAIPNLINMKRDSAKSVALDLYFSLGAIVYDQTILSKEDSLNALIYKQYPSHINNTARLGSLIDIWLTMDSLTLWKADSTLFEPDSSWLITDSIQN